MKRSANRKQTLCLSSTAAGELPDRLDPNPTLGSTVRLSDYQPWHCLLHLFAFVADAFSGEAEAWLVAMSLRADLSHHFQILDHKRPFSRPPRPLQYLNNGSVSWPNFL
jgi:hypothetical protein